MAEEPGDEEDTRFSPRDMKLWLKVEISAARLAAERRIQEAKSLVDDYASGRLNREEADRRLQEHEERWGNGANDSTLGWKIRDQASDKVLGRRLATRSTGKPDHRSR